MVGAVCVRVPRLRVEVTGRGQNRGGGTHSLHSCRTPRISNPQSNSTDPCGKAALPSKNDVRAESTDSGVIGQSSM